MDDEETVLPPLRPPLNKSSAPRDQEPDDLAQLRKWQEERLQRKLRGEYESAVLHLADVVNSNLDARLRIASVRVEGARVTRKSFLHSLIYPHIQYSSAHSPSTLGSVLHSTRGIGHVLNETGLFRSLEAKLEASRDPLASAEDVDVVFKAVEKGRFFANTSTEVGNGEASGSAKVHIRNVFGGAESFEASMSTGTKTKRSLHATFSAPLTHTLRTRGELSAYVTDRDYTSFASCYEGLRGLRAVVRSLDNAGGQHEFAYEAVLRHLTRLSETASISMRQSAGESFKSSVSHTWTRDTRDDSMMGTRGALLKVSHELAGLGGDASFYKAQGEVQLSRPLFPGTFISFAARSGALWGIGSPTLFSDRFQLGGPTSLRMFRANGMGPRDGADSLGGDVYYAAGVSLVSDVPRKAHWPVKTHVFLNAGRLDTRSKGRSVLENVRDSLARPSVSAGVGLLYRFDPIRVEVNFGVPLVASQSDGTRKGFQVGMGIEFL